MYGSSSVQLSTLQRAWAVARQASEPGGRLEPRGLQEISALELDHTQSSC